MSTATATDAQDLDDPLYGNANNDTEKVRNPVLHLCSCHDTALQMCNGFILLIVLIWQAVVSWCVSNQQQVFICEMNSDDEEIHSL